MSLHALRRVNQKAIGAVSMAVDRGLIEGILVGDEATIKAVCAAEKIDVSKFRIVQEADETKAAAKAVEMVRNGEASVLMKGLVSTDNCCSSVRSVSLSF